MAERIAQGAVPLDEAPEIAKQIAEALEAAHEQGIIHRDLKPANITVKPNGVVTVLDFGLNEKVLAVPVQSGDVFSPGQPRELFSARIALDNTNGNGFDVGPDGRFLVPVLLEQGAAVTPVTVVMNWQAEFKK